MSIQGDYGIEAAGPQPRNTHWDAEGSCTSLHIPTPWEPTKVHCRHHCKIRDEKTPEAKTDMKEGRQTLQPSRALLGRPQRPGPSTARPGQASGLMAHGCSAVAT